VLAALIAPAAALAHPLDEVVQGSYLTLAPGQVTLQLDISPGAQVADSVLRRLDADNDGKISGGEARAFGRFVLDQTSLTLDDRPVAWRLERVEAPPLENIRLGADAIKIHAVAPRSDRAGVHTLTFENRYNPAQTRAAANVFLRPGRWRYDVGGQTHGADGRRLAVYYETAR
jgi:hypothetical protein